MATCCIEGCENSISPTSITKTEKQAKPKKDVPISFHRFPKKKALKEKWLEAIGRPKWDVPSSAHVCSLHFSPSQVENGSNISGFKIKDKGCPDTALPIPVECVAATKLKVCRFCLASNTKMFNIQSGVLRTCLEAIIGLQENLATESFPEYLCYICASYSFKLYNLIEKSMIAQATLLEIYAENSEITKNHISEQNREKLNLLHNLQSYTTTPCTEYEYVYDETIGKSILKDDKLNSANKEQDKTTKEESTVGDTSTRDTESGAKRLKKLSKKMKKNIDECEHLLMEISNEPLANANKLASCSKAKNNNDNFETDPSPDEKSILRKYLTLQYSDSDEDNDKTIKKSDIKDHDYLQVDATRNKFNITESNALKVAKKIVQQSNTKKCVKFSSESSDLPNVEIKSKMEVDVVNQSVNSVNDDTDFGIESEPLLDHHFKILQLSYDDQVQEWERMTKMTPKPKDSNQCEVCGKWVRRGSPYLDHLARHDPRIGKYECDVCKMRFAKDYLLNNHVVMAHSKSFHCKSCPSVLPSITSARFHLMRHMSPPAACGECGRLFTTRVGLRIHIAAKHSTKKRRNTLMFARSQDYAVRMMPQNYPDAKASKLVQLAGASTDGPRSQRRQMYGPGKGPIVVVKHQRVRSQISYECPICDNKFKTTEALSVHIVQAHQPKPYEDDHAPEVEYLDFDELVSDDDVPMEVECAKETAVSEEEDDDDDDDDDVEEVTYCDDSEDDDD